MTVPNLFGGTGTAGSGVPNLFAAPSAAGSTGLEALLAQARALGIQPQGAESAGHTPWGFVGNLLGGVADMGKGIAGLLGSGLHDLGMLGVEAATLGKAETDMKTDDIAKAMLGFTEHGFHPTESVIAKDLGERYGMLLPGGRPASQFLQKLYDNPLAFALDAASVAGAAAKGVQMAGVGALGGKTALADASNALKAIEAGGEAAAAATAPTGALARAATVLNELKGTAGVGARSANAAAIRAGLDTLAEAGTLSPFLSKAKMLLPKETFRVLESGSTAAEHFLPSTTALNPFNRLFTTPIRRLTTEPIDKLIGQTEGLYAKMEGGALDEARAPLAKDIGTRNLYEEIISGAAERGMNRIDIAPLRKTVYPQVLARRIEKTLAADSLRLREREAKEMHDLIVQAAEEDRAFNHANMDAYHITSQGLDVYVNGMKMEPWAAQRFHELAGKNIDLADAPEAGINITLSPSVRTQLADDPLLKRVDDVVAQLQEIRAKFDDPSMEAWNPAAQQGAVDRIIRSLNLSLERRAAGYDNPAIKLSDHARVIDIENRLPMMKNLETNPYSYLDRIYGAIKQKYLTGGLRADNPALAARSGVLERVEALSKLEWEVKTLLAGRTPKGSLRAIRKMLGEEKYASIRPVLEGLSDDPARLVQEMVRRDPEGGLLKQILEADNVRAIKGTTVPQAAPVIGGKVFRGLPDVSPDAAAPVGTLVGPTRAAQESTLGVAMSLADEIRSAIDDPRAYDALFGEATNTRSLMKRLREVLSDPVATQRNALRGLDDSPDSLLLDDAFVRAGLEQPSYFPFIRDEGKTGSDFFAIKKTTGANILARDPHEARFFGTLLKEGNYITDPMEAFARRAARRAREINTYESWSTRIKRMGRVVTDAEQIPDGWVAVSPDALFLKHRIHMQFIEKLEDYRLNGMDPDTAFARALEDVGHRTLDDLDTLIGEGKPTVYAIPKALDDEIGAAAKWARAGGGKYVRAAYDPFMNTWRSLVLTGSPRWVVNNILGNTVMGAMQGVKVMDVTRILGERLRALFAQWVQKHPQLEALIGDVVGPAEIRPNSLAGRVAAMPYEGLTGSGFFAKNNLEAYKPRLGQDAAETRIGRAVQATRTPGTKSYAAMSMPRRWSEAIRSLNGEIEASFREASFLTAVEKQMGKSAIQRTGRTFWDSKRRIEDIMDSGYDEAAARAAVDEVDHFFGNYTALGPFERHVMRRWLVPFWGFYKHTVKLMLSFPVQYPLRAQVLRSLSLATQEMMKEYGPMPGWLEGAIPLTPPGDEVTFLRTAGANPFTGMFEDPTQMLSPALKLFLEQSTGKNLFTGEGFTDKNTYKPFGSDQNYALDQLDENGMPTPVQAPRPGILEAIASQVPQYDMIERAIAGGIPYDTANVFSLLRGRATGSREGVILDTDPTSPTYGQPKYPQGTIDQLKKLSGFNAQPYDLGAYQENLTADQIAALRELIKRMTAQEMAG